MNESTFRHRFHARLDARQDPFDDADLVAFLDAHPEHLAAWAQLRRDAATLALLRPPLAKAARIRRALVAGGGAAAAAILAALWLHAGPPAGRVPRIVAASVAEVRPRAHAAATIVVHEPLLSSANARLEIYAQWSERR